MKLLAWGAALAVFLLVMMTLSFAAMFGSLPATSSALATGPSTVPGVPPDYLALYVQAASENSIDWAILAAIGKVETDHGRIQGGRCATSSAGARGPMQFMPATWDSYGKGGDVCDPRDAIPAAARYLVAGGAPGDYRRSIFSYNHAEWYVAKIMAQAEEYRALSVSPAAPGDTQSGPPSEQWLLEVPGTGQQCDARIVANVLMIVRRFHATVTACYAPTGHEASGEHPLGLAVDLAPTPPASWQVMADLARFAGWKPSCASSGCAGQTGTAFRFVGYNDYPGHGDPAHAGGNAHLHLSWDHGPGRPASWVRLVAG